MTWLCICMWLSLDCAAIWWDLLTSSHCQTASIGVMVGFQILFTWDIIVECFRSNSMWQILKKLKKNCGGDKLISPLLETNTVMVCCHLLFMCGYCDERFMSPSLLVDLQEWKTSPNRWLKDGTKHGLFAVVYLTTPGHCSIKRIWLQLI